MLLVKWCTVSAGPWEWHPAAEQLLHLSLPAVPECTRHCTLCPVTRQYIRR